MRSKVALLALAAGLVAYAASAEMTVDEIIAKNLDARGGKDTIAAVDSAKVTGTMTMGPGMEVPFTMEWMRPNKIRMEMTVQGKQGIQAFDGTQGWMYMPFMGKTEPEKMPAEATSQMEEQADMIEGPLFNYKEKGNQVELMGKEEIEGTPAYKLRVTLKNGTVIFDYLDADAFLEIAQETHVKRGDQEVDVLTSQGNYKEVDGLVLPFVITTKMKNAPEGTPGQTVTIKSYELGATIDPADFAFPETKEAPATPDQGGC